jgi:hypothetical protein
MTSPDLSAFIPTNKNDAVKVRWVAMPYDAILQALSTEPAAALSALTTHGWQLSMVSLISPIHPDYS